MSLLRKLMMAGSKNETAQQLLETLHRKTLFYLGVGAGDDVNTSGEAAIVEAMTLKGSPPYVVFDVGANQGQFLNLILATIGADACHVHCFEPARHTCEMLRQTVGDNSHVTVNPFGLGREPGSHELYYDRRGSGFASLTRRDLSHLNIAFSESESVTIDTLDRYCRRRGIDRIDLLKIDVEGHELDVLYGGAGEMFKKSAVGMVSFEFGGCNIDTRIFFRDFYRFFKDIGMALYRITPTGYLYPLPAYREDYERFITTNFLAVRE